jgi:ribosomal protein L7/L12
MSWYWVAAIAAVVLLGVMSRAGERAGSRRLRAGDGPASAERIDDLIRAGRKIEAIKEYRALHGVDLKAAKDAVEARARELGR